MFENLKKKTNKEKKIKWSKIKDKIVLTHVYNHLHGWKTDNATKRKIIAKGSILQKGIENQFRVESLRGFH